MKEKDNEAEIREAYHTDKIILVIYGGFMLFPILGMLVTSGIINLSMAFMIYIAAYSFFVGIIKIL